MLSHLIEITPEISREKLLWAVVVALVAGQLLAFWMICSHQVRQAEVRDAALQVERVAISDCLQYIPRATVTSCASRIAMPDREATGAASISPARLGSNLPANFAFH
jgi:hypothetical protein